jgi:hypothetical protein
MPEDKLSNIERLSTTPLSTNGGASLLSSEADLRETALAALESRYKAVQELVGQLSKMQGRLPTEVDQKLQALLQQINLEQQSLSENLSNKQPTRQDTSSTLPPPTPEQQQSLRQLSVLLSQQPLPAIPSVIKSEIGQRVTADAIYSTLIKLIQQQPAAWRPDTALGKNTLNWLLQSQLALKPEHWPTLPQQTRNQLTQAGILPPMTPANPPQRQLIQQITSQTVNLLAQQKNEPAMLLTKTVECQNILSTPSTPSTALSAPITTTIPAQKTALPSNVSNSSSIDIVLKTFLNTLPPEEAPLPNPVKVLLQQVRNLLQQPESNSTTTSNAQMNSSISLPSRLQPLFNNPLLSEINNKPVTSTSIAHIQTALSELALSITADPVTTKIANAQPLPVTPKADVIWPRLLIQLSMPKIMQSPELLAQIKTTLPEQIWLPATAGEWTQYQRSFESLQNSTLQLAQQLSVTLPQATPAASPSAGQLNKAIADSPNDSIIPIQAVSRNGKGNNIAALQQLLTSLQQDLLPRTDKATDTDPLPANLKAAAELLLNQFSSPLQTSDHVRNWMQFLLQPLDGDGAYSKAMQQWLVQLLQFRLKTNQKMQQASVDDSAETINIKNQLATLDKLGENTMESFRLAPQPAPNNSGQLPSLLHFPLPPQHNGEEPGSLNLQRNTREDNERGWSISLYLEPAKLGPIRFQARIALPEIALSIVAEKTATVDLIKQTYPLLEQRFQSLGLTPQKLQIRQGKTKKDTASSIPTPSSGLSVKV